MVVKRGRPLGPSLWAAFYRRDPLLAFLRRFAGRTTSLLDLEIALAFRAIGLQCAPLMSTLVMWMIFVAYLLLRRFAGTGSETLAAAVGLFGMVLAPFVYWSVNIWRTLHPTTNVVPSLPREMMGPFVWSIVAFLLLYTALLLVRVRIETGRATIEDAYAVLED